MKHYFPLLLMVLLIGLSGCSNPVEETSTEDGKLHVYTTVYPLKYFAEEIGGELVKVETIYPPGADEHTFEPSQKDMIKLADSELFIYVGLGLEGFVTKAKSTLSNEDVIFHEAGEHIELEGSEEVNHGHDHEHEDHHHGDIDPHVWIDPLYALELAESIKNRLIQMLPEQEEMLEENFSVLSDRLLKLDEDFSQSLHAAKRKDIVVAHAAYGYWERYGIQQISILGLSSSSEPTQKELKAIIDVGAKNDINYVFFEQNVTSRLAETVQKELGAESLILHNLSVLTEEDIQQNRDYFSIMEDNLTALNTALN